MTTSWSTIDRRGLIKKAGTALAGVLAVPMIGHGQANTIKIGMPTVLSGRVAQLGTSSRNAVFLEVEKINATGGLAGRPIEMMIRDSKGKPDEAARVVRDFVNSDGCEIILNAELSSSSFAVQEVVRELGVLCLHTISETSSLTADPKLHVPSAFRIARQGIHDAIAGGAYAASIADTKGLKTWMTCSPDYAYGRDSTGLFEAYLKQFAPNVEIVSESWPRLFQPDYTEVITKILQTKPQALYSCLYGGDLTSFIDQGNIYSLFDQIETFAINMADYTALTTVKNLPKGIHSATRYIKTFPAMASNAAWGDAYRVKFNEYPTNWSWENAAALSFLTAAAKKANSADSEKLAEVLPGMTIDSPFGEGGKLTIRADDHTLINYAIGWGTTIPTEPYVPNITPANWNQILSLEADWKKKNDYA